jgi:mono/diheme cytochrome c family protein
VEKNQMNAIIRKALALGAALAIAAVLTTSAVAQGGADLYKTKCASCHGADGTASAIGVKMGAKNFSDPDVAKSTDATWTDITTNGKAKMPGYKGKLTDDQIKDLVKFVRTLATKK